MPPSPAARIRMLPWLRELAAVPTGLVAAYVPGAGIPARTREQLILAVSRERGVRTSVWVHGAWLDYLGRRDPDEALAPLFDYARSCAEAGRPLDTTVLEAVFPPKVVRTVRATVARAHVGNAVGGAVDAFADRLTGGPVGPGVLVDATRAATALPLVVPMAGLALAMRAAARVAPVLPTVELPDEEQANLVSHLLAEAAPSYLGHVGVRAGLALSPVQVAVAFRMEGSTATIRVGRGRVEVANGIAPDALVVVDGGIEPLLSTVASSILRDLGVPLRRR